MWAKIKQFFAARDLDHEYLCGAVDVCDLERRMKQIDRGTAPHQVQSAFASKVFAV